jgi:hypothetical protein
MHSNSINERRIRLWILALFSAYFLYFNWDRITMHFAADEMMNIGAYFHRGPWRTIVSQIAIWKNAPRPLGGLFYLPLYYAFGLNPAPYQIVFTLILAANGFWLYRFARSLNTTIPAATVAAFVGLYHPGLTNLHYNTDMVFDILCFFFYFAAFDYYVQIRRDAKTPCRREITIFLVLYLAALNSKEMAVTLPVVLLAYEWLYHRSARFRGSWRLIVPAIAMNLLYVVGKAFGPDPLTKAGGYDMVFSLDRLFKFQMRSVGEIVCWTNELTWLPVVAIWAVVTLIAWARKKPELRLCWWIMVIAPLPIEFLSGRGQGCLYIPMAAWVVFAAVNFLDALRALSTLLFRLFDKNGVLALALSTALLVWCVQVRHWKKDVINPSAEQQGTHTHEMIRQFQQLNPRVRPGGRIVFLHNPFEGWDMAFIAELLLKDRRVDVRLQDHNPLPACEFQTADAIFDYREGKLIQVR